MKTTLSFATSMLIASLATAQGSVVSPAHFGPAEGTTSNSFPFGSTAAPFRYLNVHDDMSGTPRVIKGMALRRNGTTTSAFAAYTVTLSAWLSTAATTSTTASTTFDNNHGTDKAQVATNRTYNFPATVHAFVPSPFVYLIPYDVPFSFGGTAGLAWEVQITAKTNTTNYFLDASSGTGNADPNLAVSRYGTGCTATGRTSAMAATGSSNMDWPNNAGTLTVTGSNAPANAPLILLIGFSSDLWNGVPLPLAIPGSASGPSGECNVYTDVLLTVAGTASATGASTFSIPLRPNLSWHGLRTFEQIAALDAMANTFGLVTSNGVNHNFVAPYGPIPGARVYASGNLNPTGTAAQNYSLIVRFDL